MEYSGKQGSSDASSTEENDQVKGGGDTAATTTTTTTTAKRSYECTFCKRGFTNAQALGGHMNIHRKDRAKAKHPTITSSSIRSSDQSTMNIDQDYMINPSFANLPPIIPTEPTKFYPVSDQPQRNYNNYHMYFQPPLSYSSSPNKFPYGYYDHDHHRRHQLMVTAGSQSLSMNEEHLGANLSLRIGPTHVDDDMKEDDEVDLELRLGHHP